jgi:hypothetical protein
MEYGTATKTAPFATSDNSYDHALQYVEYSKLVEVASGDQNVTSQPSDNKVYILFNIYL